MTDHTPPTTAEQFAEYFARLLDTPDPTQQFVEGTDAQETPAQMTNDDLRRMVAEGTTHQKEN